MGDSSREMPMPKSRGRGSLFGWDSRAKKAGHVLMQIPELVSPLRDNPERVLQESDYDEEAADCREMGPKGLRVYFHVVFDLFRVVAELFDRDFWVGGPVACRRLRITNPMRIRAVADALWAGYIYAGRHFVRWKENERTTWRKL